MVYGIIDYHHKIHIDFFLKLMLKNWMLRFESNYFTYYFC